jgi:hypothetical protein
LVKAPFLIASLSNVFILSVSLPSANWRRISFWDWLGFLLCRFHPVSSGFRVMHLVTVGFCVLSNSNYLLPVGAFPVQHFIIVGCSNQSLFLHHSNSSSAIVGILWPTISHLLQTVTTFWFGMIVCSKLTVAKWFDIRALPPLFVLSGRSPFSAQRVSANALRSRHSILTVHLV